MRIGSTVLGVLALLIGCVWMLQGLNYFGGSFMSGQRTWFWIGLVVAAAALAWIGWRNFGGRGSR